MRKIINPTDLELNDETVVCINRVSKATTGGRTMNFNSVVAVGDGKGHVGIGFGKNLAQNLEIMQNIQQFKIKKCGIILGTSRKSWINGMDKSDVNNRLGGSIASALYCYKKGVNMFRVHDVKETYQSLKVYKNLCLM